MKNSELIHEVRNAMARLDALALLIDDGYRFDDDQAAIILEQYREALDLVKKALKANDCF